MIHDHILCFPDEARAKAALAGVTYRGLPIVADVLDQDGQPTGETRWHIGQPVTAVVSEAEWDDSGERPVLTRARVVAPGFFVVVPQDAENTALRGLSGKACRLIARRPQKGRPAGLVHTASDAPMSSLRDARLSGMFAGGDADIGTAIRSVSASEVQPVARHKGQR